MEAPEKQGTTFLPGAVWFAQASIGGQSQAFQPPGNTASVPVYVTVATGHNLSGLQFRAIVSPNGVAPVAGAVTFTPAASTIPELLSEQGLTANDIVRAGRSVRSTQVWSTAIIWER